jgi:glycosyltransferase involved in cell wall biosynthesis
MICPTTQLFLPGNRLCEGPQRMMENCVKHLAFKSTNSSLAKKISLIPDSAIRLMQHTLLLYPKLQVGHLADLAALTKRTRYIVEQVNRAKRVIVSNGFMHTILQKHGVAAAIIRKIPFGISPFETVDACPQSDNSALRVGFIGTLNFHKGAHILIKAVRELSNSRRIQVSIYGNRDQFPNYVLMLDEIVGNDARIDFKGTFPSDQIGRVLGSLDLLVVPSLWYENTPLVIHQAHAARVPVIASNLGGMNEVVRDRQNGFLIQPGNTGQLSAILESLIDNRSVLEKIRSKIEPPLMIDRYADLIEEQYHAAVNCEVRDNS